MTWEDRSGRIDHAAPLLLWSQVAGDMRADIVSGRLASGVRVPSELALAEIYGVARVTVHRAIAELVSENLLTVVRGRGTFVALSS